ncbi:hypothetical protein YC2023_050528 [Brassica napus]
MNRRIAMTIALGKFTKDEKDLFDIMDDWLRRDRFVNIIEFHISELGLSLGEIDMSVKMRTTCTWTERPYEASLLPGIGFGLFLRSLGGRRRRPHSGRARAISEIPLWKS